MRVLCYQKGIITHTLYSLGERHAAKRCMRVDGCDLTSLGSRFEFETVNCQTTHATWAGIFTQCKHQSSYCWDAGEYVPSLGLAVNFGMTSMVLGRIALSQSVVISQFGVVRQKKERRQIILQRHSTVHNGLILVRRNASI
jgi:hypothetical protein